MTVQVTVDKVKLVQAAIKELANTRVMVGIPSDKAARTGKGQAINNAQLGYIHEFGAPEVNIPARPSLYPGVRSVQDSSTIPRLKEAGKNALDGNKPAMLQQFHAIGLIASTAVKKRITDNIPPPLSPRTIAGRARQRGTKSKRKSELQYATLVSQGVSPEAAQQQTGLIALINTGGFLRSFTYVIRKVRK